jgi:hypothetical protein
MIWNAERLKTRELAIHPRWFLSRIRKLPAEPARETL